MSLMWVCSCGEQVSAEEMFTDEELSEIEFAINHLNAKVFSALEIMPKSEKRIIVNLTKKQALYESIIEKVRKM